MEGSGKARPTHPAIFPECQLQAHPHWPQKCPELGSPRGGSRTQCQRVGQEVKGLRQARWSSGPRAPTSQSLDLSRLPWTECSAGRIQGEGLLDYLGRPNPITQVLGSGDSFLVRSEKSGNRGSEMCCAGFEDGGGGHGPGNEEASGSWKR